MNPPVVGSGSVLQIKLGSGCYMQDGAVTLVAIQLAVLSVSPRAAFPPSTELWMLLPVTSNPHRYFEIHSCEPKTVSTLRNWSAWRTAHPLPGHCVQDGLVKVGWMDCVTDVPLCNSFQVRLWNFRPAGSCWRVKGKKKRTDVLASSRTSDFGRGRV